jgi:hypothetical protein
MPLKPDARAALQEENQQLDQLIAISSDPWRSFFARWKVNNERLINNSNDTQVEQELNEEINRLQDMINSIKTSTPGAMFWKTSLNEDKSATQELLAKP